jgi:hypothetical protein
VKFGDLICFYSFLAEHPNELPSKPQANKTDWDRFQDMYYSTLLCMNVHVEDRANWERGITSIYREVHVMLSLGSALGIHPTTDATVLLMPTQKLFCLLLTNDQDIEDASLIAEVRTHDSSCI